MRRTEGSARRLMKVIGIFLSTTIIPYLIGNHFMNPDEMVMAKWFVGFILTLVLFVVGFAIYKIYQYIMYYDKYDKYS